MVQLFHWMATRPLIFMVLWPSLCILIIALGWGTTDNIVEDNVSEQWVPTRGEYAANQRYARSVSGDGGLGATTVAAMAIARDGGNLFTAERLEMIRSRMEQAETIEVEYNNETYRWSDVCLDNAGFPYRLPCSRLSPMDFFQEARWFFDETARVTWYNDLIQKQLVAPRLPRFGILMGQCASTACSDVVQTRLANDEAFLLLKDAGGLDYSDPCRNCIEEGYESLINQWAEYIPATFGRLASQISDEPISANLQTLAASITIDDIVEFHYYYTTRSVYGTLGAPLLLDLYSGLSEYVGLCTQYGLLVGLTCPPATLTLEDATNIMWSHADADFSSVNTAGIPLPLWDQEDGTGTLFKGSSTVGGSGIDMSGSFGSIDAYLAQVASNENITADPMSPEWTESVEKNPFYAWFMASLTPASENTACRNGNIPGTALSDDETVKFLASQNFTVPNPFEADGGMIGLQDLALAIDSLTFELIQNNSQAWCNVYTIPNENTTTTGEDTYTKQHFGKMWYDLLIASSAFLDIQEGLDDPYTWTISEGCGYELRGERGSYTGRGESEILNTASADLYYIDEGSSFGVVDQGLLIGGSVPPVKEASPENPLKKASVLQTIYPVLVPKDITERVANCHRPGGPMNITIEDAEEILFLWKEAMEHAWSEDWQDENTEIQFVAFSDDAGIVGSTGRMLREITLSNTALTIISIVAIAAFSVLFMFSSDVVESRVVVTLVGVCLVVLSFFAAVGLGLLVGIKIQITIAWTLPFVILGLGVDDMYIVLHALRQQQGYTEEHYMNAMREVLVPVTMTSVVNASMFAILNISDIPAVYESARIALFAVIGLYCSVILCFPAYCYVDMKRQQKRKSDICRCSATGGPESAEMPRNENGGSSSMDLDWRSVLLYDKLYLPLVLGSKKSHTLSYIIIWTITASLLGASAYGLTQISVGLGLEEFFPRDNPASVWATTRTTELASWNIGMRWGAIEYTDPQVQMKMIQQFEKVIESDKISQTDTDQLWLGSFLLWSSRLCDSNLVKDNFMQKNCGHDKNFADGSVCSATWTENTFGLRDHFRADPDDPKCYNFAAGICRKASSLHSLDLDELKIDSILNQDISYCPVIDSWSDEKWQFCVKEWRTVTGADAGFILKQPKGSATECSGEYETDQDIVWPIPISTGPTMYASDLFSHDDTLDLIKETSEVCSNDQDVHCWLTGIPFDYWTQYENIQYSLLRFGAYSCAIGFLISFSFLFINFFMDGSHDTGKLLKASLIGALMIFSTIALSFISVVGLSLFAGVSLTGFSNMSFVLSVGFSVEFAVHIVARWMRCDPSIVCGLDRVRYVMSFLALPTFMSFVSSAIGVCCLAFTAFDFNETYFFRPLIIVMFVTYFYGCWWLPSILVLIETDAVRLGANTPIPVPSKEVAAPIALAPVKSFDSERNC